MAQEQTHKAAPNEDQTRPVLEDYIGYNLKRSYLVVYQDFRTTLGEEGLGTRDFSALALIVQFPNLTQRDVAGLLGIEGSGLVKIIDQLEAQNYIIRTRVPSDRRAYALVATEAGVAAFKDAAAKLDEHEDRILADFTDDERATLFRLLQKIRRAE